MIIAIDGPSGTGKGTAASGLASRLGLLHVDTGAMYRAFAYACLDKAAPPEEVIETFAFRVAEVGGKKRYWVGDEEVTEKIRTPEVTQESSKISVHPFVRKQMVALQQQIGSENDAVLEGRDIGTVVFPNADFKFYLTASPEVRAKRRYLELQEKGGITTEAEVLAEQLERDERDQTRETSPLRPASDAVIIDTSILTREEVIDQLVTYIQGER